MEEEAIDDVQAEFTEVNEGTTALRMLLLVEPDGTLSPGGATTAPLPPSPCRPSLITLSPAETYHPEPHRHPPDAVPISPLPLPFPATRVASRHSLPPPPGRRATAAPPPPPQNFGYGEV